MKVSTRLCVLLLAVMFYSVSVLWLYTFVPAKLLIITSSALEEQALRLASYRNEMGVRTIVKTTDWIDKHYSGRDLQESIRFCINETRKMRGIEYILLFGDAQQVPVRRVFVVVDFDEEFIATDLYYADLQYTWDENNDGTWGDLLGRDYDNEGRCLGRDKVDGVPDLCLGRLPVGNVVEASRMVDKIIGFESKSHKRSDSKILLVGTDLDVEFLCKHIKNNFVSGGTEVNELYSSSEALNATILRTLIDGGYDLLFFGGHGSPSEWIFGDESVFDVHDVQLLRNGLELPIIFTISCVTSKFTKEWCLGKEFMVAPYGGAIAYFGSTGVSWLNGTNSSDGLSGEMVWRFWKAIYEGERNLGKVWLLAVSEYVRAHPVNEYVFVEGYGGYFHWKAVAGFGCPFMDPTLEVTFTI